MTDTSGSPLVSQEQTEPGREVLAHMEKEILTLTIREKKSRRNQ